MKRISKKKLVILLIIVLAIAAIAISIGLSRALKIEIIQVNIIDSEGKLAEESISVEGMIDDEYHYIFLPREANNYIIDKYYVEDTDLAFENGFMDADSYYNDEEYVNDEIDKDTTQSESSENVEEVEEAAEVEEVTEVEEGGEKIENGVLHPHDFLMLSPEQIESKSVTIKVKYDYIEDEENGRMYKKEILQDSSYSTQFETFDSKAGIEAYAPEEVSVELQEVEKEYNELLKEYN